MAEIEVFVEHAGGVQSRGDPGHLGDHPAFQGGEGRASSRPASSGSDSLRRAAGELGDHQEAAASAARGPMCSPAATTSGTSIPSARTRSRWAHSAAAGECLPAGSNECGQPRGPGEPEMPLQINRQRPIRLGQKPPVPSTALAWRETDRGSRAS